MYTSDMAKRDTLTTSVLTIRYKSVVEVKERKWEDFPKTQQ